MKFYTFASVLLLSLQVNANPVKRQDAAAASASSPTGYSCKCYEGDACWPSNSAWNTLNSTVGGRLLKFVPTAAVCHNKFESLSTYDAAKCAEVTENYGNQAYMCA